MIGDGTPSSSKRYDPKLTEVEPPPQGPLPHPHLERMRFPFPIIWIVPLLAALGASIYLYRYYQERGPEIRIRFEDVAGIKTGETPLTVHGVRIGTVEQVDLSPDAQGAIVHVRIQRHALAVAKAGSLFWMVRPDVFGGQITGLGTIISGPYIEGIAGTGADQLDFTGSEHSPLMLGEGVRLIVHASQLGKLDLNSPVFYRGIAVGQVQDIRLSDDSRSANLTLFIPKRYELLVRSDSQFWRVKTADVTGGLLGGIDIHLPSLQTLLGGGIAFATPEPSSKSDRAFDGTAFDLHEEVKQEWLDWSPRIELPPTTEPDRELNAGLRSAIRVR